MFLKNIRVMLPLFDSIGGGGGGSADVEGNTNIADDISFLNDETPDVDDKGEKGEESEEDKDKNAIKADENLLNDEEGEEEEEEQEEEETDEEKEEKALKAKEEEKNETKDDDPLKEATYSAIKKKYPDFFKNFPAAKNQLFGADAFRRALGVETVDEAKEYKEQSEAITNSFEAVRGMIEGGEVDNFLTEVKGISDEAYKNFVVNFMPALYGNDEKMYYSIVTPIVRTAIKNIYQRGLKNGGAKGGKEDNFGQNLVNAAIVLHHALFDSDEVEKEDEPLVARKDGNEGKKDPEKEKFEKERNAFYEGKYKTLHSDVDNKVTTTVKDEIKKGLNTNIPKYVLDKLVDDIFNEINKQVGKDEVHINSINALWKKEQAAGFTGVNKDSIINAVLSRARPLIPVVRKKIATEAMKDFRGKISSGGSSKNGEKREVKAAPSGGKQKKETPNLRDTSRYSDDDILNMD